MILSVFNWNTLDFDYFENDATADQGGWYELQGLGIGSQARDTGVGVDIESALPSLPADAVYIGSGERAKGRVCVKRDSVDRGDSSRKKTMSGTIFGGRLVNLQTLPEKDRIPFNQDRDIHLLDYSGPGFLQVEPRNVVPSDVNQPIPGFPHLLGSNMVPAKALGEDPTKDSSAGSDRCECKRELPISLFLVPIIAGSTAGYALGSRGNSLKTILATGIGFLVGLGAGIQLGREYEGYKMSTYLNLNKDTEKQK